jgi:hypothetical protein
VDRPTLRKTLLGLMDGRVERLLEHPTPPIAQPLGAARELGAAQPLPHVIDGEFGDVMVRR